MALHQGSRGGDGLADAARWVGAGRVGGRVVASALHCDSTRLFSNASAPLVF